MVRDLPSAFTDAAQGDTLEPIWLLRIATGLIAPDDYLWFCSDAADVVFDGETYVPRAFKLSESVLDTAKDGGQTVEVADPDNEFNALIETDGADFIDKRVRLYRVERSLTGTATNRQRDDYLISQDPQLSEDKIVFSLRPLTSIFEVRVPLGIATRDELPGLTEKAI